MRRIALLNAVIALHTVQGFLLPTNLPWRSGDSGSGSLGVAVAEGGRSNVVMMKSNAPFATQDEVKGDKGLKVRLELGGG